MAAAILSNIFFPLSAIEGNGCSPGESLPKAQAAKETKRQRKEAMTRLQHEQCQVACNGANMLPVAFMGPETYLFLE